MKSVKNLVTFFDLKNKNNNNNVNSINNGYNQFCRDMKRFNNKQEMLGFVIGYNEAMTHSFAETLGYSYYELKT